MYEIDGDVAEGRKRLQLSGRPVVASRTSSGVHVTIVDATTSYYDYFYFTVHGEELEGLACTGLKTAATPSPSTCRGVLFGNRAFSPAESRRAWTRSAETNASVADDAPRNAEPETSAPDELVAAVRAKIVADRAELDLITHLLRSSLIK